MKFRITGEYKVFLADPVGIAGKEEEGAWLDLIVDAQSKNDASQQALELALKQYPESINSFTSNVAYWLGKPEITELPPDQENLLLPPDVAPRLPGF